MTPKQAIERLDSLIRNAYTKEDKLAWLTRVDWMIKKHIIDCHEDSENVVYNGYTAENEGAELLATPPYDDLYIRFMEAQIHYYNGEYDKYNNAIIEFQSAYDAFAAMYTREHMPLNAGKRFLF